MNVLFDFFYLLSSYSISILTHKFPCINFHENWIMKLFKKKMQIFYSQCYLNFVVVVSLMQVLKNLLNQFPITDYHLFTFTSSVHNKEPVHHLSLNIFLLSLRLGRFLIVLIATKRELKQITFSEFPQCPRFCGKYILNFHNILLKQITVQSSVLKIWKMRRTVEKLTHGHTGSHQGSQNSNPAI